MNKVFTIGVGISLGFGLIGQAQVVVHNDTIFNTASQMLLANELFESGEPFAEEIGYDLDLLDPEVINMPDTISYTTGIENYEYSRYLLNTLTGRSAMGLHMMWSPIIMQNAAMQLASFDGMFTGGTANGYKEDDMLMMMIGNFGTNANQTPPANAFPQFADFVQGNVVLPQTVDADFASNFGSTRWNRNLMVKTLNPGAMGQSMWKQYFWAQDMLSAFHDENDEGIDATGTNSPDSVGSPNFDPDNNIFYGGNNLDGYIGQVLTAVSINKTALLINMLAYDGTALGAVDPATYDPNNGIKYFPTSMAVTESIVLAGLPPQGTSFTVTDANSSLFDQMSLLLATSSFKNMMNPSDNSDAAHLAYHEAFDGFPFPADMAATGTPGPFDLMTGASKVIFLNMMAMHYNATAGTFVNLSGLDGSGNAAPEDDISAENAGYALITLANFSAQFGGTPLQTMADGALVAQADFIVNNMSDINGGFFNSYTVGSGASSDSKTLAANSALIQGLYAAYTATNDIAYKNMADAGYNFLINNFYVPQLSAFRTEMNNNTATYTPSVLAYLSGALREASLVGAQSEAAAIYSRVFKKVYNAMILTEAEPSGETGGDSDGDGVPYIAGGTRPFVFAENATMDLNTVGLDDQIFSNTDIDVYPNPARDLVNIQIDREFSDLYISIFDISGKKLIEVSRNEVSGSDQHITVPISELAAGNYIVRISTDSQLTAIKKLIVH